MPNLFSMIEPGPYTGSNVPTASPLSMGLSGIRKDMMRPNQQLEVYKELSKYFKPSAVAGIMGNIDVETGGTFDYRQKQHKGGPGHGLFQFDFQKPAYFKWLGDRPDSIQEQIGFMRHLIYSDDPLLGPGNQAKLRQGLDSLSPEEVAQLFAERYEKPRKGSEHYDRRKAAAIGYANDYFS